MYPSTYIFTLKGKEQHRKKIRRYNIGTSNDPTSNIEEKIRKYKVHEITARRYYRSKYTLYTLPLSKVSLGPSMKSPFGSSTRSRILRRTPLPSWSASTSQHKWGPILTHLDPFCTMLQHPQTHPSIGHSHLPVSVSAPNQTRTSQTSPKYLNYKLHAFTSHLME